MPALALPDRAYCRGAHAQRQRHPEHAFAPEQTDLEHGVAINRFVDCGKQGNDARIRKDRVPNFFADIAQHLTIGEIDAFEMRRQPAELVGGQSGKNTVGTGTAARWHRSPHGHWLANRRHEEKRLTRPAPYECRMNTWFRLLPGIS